MPPGVRLIIAFLFPAYLLYRTGPGALLFLFPSLMRQKAEPSDDYPPEMDPAPASKLAVELAALGFTRLGVRRERFPLGTSALSYDYVNAEEKAYASIYLVDRRRARLYFFTPYDGGASVLTADHVRPRAVNDGYYLAGGVVGAAPAQVWAAHKRQMVAMEETGRDRVAKATLEDRLAVAHQWVVGVGKREVRARTMTAFFSSLIAMMALYVILTVLHHQFATLGFQRLADSFVRG